MLYIGTIRLQIFFHLENWNSGPTEHWLFIPSTHLSLTTAFLLSDSVNLISLSTSDELNRTVFVLLCPAYLIKHNVFKANLCYNTCHQFFILILPFYHGKEANKRAEVDGLVFQNNGFMPSDLSNTFKVLEERVDWCLVATEDLSPYLRCLSDFSRGWMHHLCIADIVVGGKIWARSK